MSAIGEHAQLPLTSIYVLISPESIGEYAALAIAGILDVQDALLLVAKRAELIGTHCVPEMSGMVTCRSTVDVIKPLLESDGTRFSGINIACMNSQEDIVVAGPMESLSCFIKYCKNNGIKAKQLKVPYGFHSSCMDPLLGDLEAFVSTSKFRKAKIAFGSSLQGRLLGFDDKLPADYLVRHTRESVKFHSVIEDIERSFPDTVLDFIEVGPFPSSKCSLWFSL